MLFDNFISNQKKRKMITTFSYNNKKFAIKKTLFKCMIVGVHIDRKAPTLQLMTNSKLHQYFHLVDIF